MRKSECLPVLAIASLALCSVPLAASGADFPPSPVGHGGAQVNIIATGLHDPRGMVFGPDGYLYVAEAGTTEGHYFPDPLVIDADTQTRDRCFVDWPLGKATPGYTGRISKIGSGGSTTVIDGLPSMALNPLVGGDRMGAGAIAFAGSNLYAVTPGGGCSHGHLSDPKTNLVIRVKAGNTGYETIADLGEYLRTHPASKSPTEFDFEPDGTWYALLHAWGALYTIEPNHGGMVQIDGHGIRPCANLWEKIKRIDANGDGDKTPTALIKHRNAFFIGTLERIKLDSAAYVYRLSADPISGSW